MGICPIVDWSIIQTTIWITDKSVFYSDAICIPKCYWASEYQTICQLFICPINFIGKAARYHRVRNSNGSVIWMSGIQIPSVHIKTIVFTNMQPVPLARAAGRQLNWLFQVMTPDWTLLLVYKILTFSDGAFIQILKAWSSFCRTFFPETWRRYENGSSRILSCEGSIQ